jgi:hypothetical protein
MKKKPFKETKVGKWLTENAPNVLDTVDDYFPPAKILTAIVKGTSIPDEKKLEFEKLAAEYDQNERRDYLADVANARQMQIEALKQDDLFSKRYTYYLASFIVIFAFGIGVMLFFVEFPESNRRMIEMLFDLLIFSGALTVIQFFFGSSKGSADKTKMLK